VDFAPVLVPVIVGQIRIRFESNFSRLCVGVFNALAVQALCRARVHGALDARVLSARVRKVGVTMRGALVVRYSVRTGGRWQLSVSSLPAAALGRGKA
jgi:hypothetical protein